MNIFAVYECYFDLVNSCWSKIFLFRNFLKFHNRTAINVGILVLVYSTIFTIYGTKISLLVVHML